jgi:hypothetical protein
MLELLSAITSTEREDRIRACGIVSDVLRETNDLEAVVLASTLCWAALVERDFECREAELYCLSTLVEWDLAPPYAYEALATLDRGSLRGSEVEYFDVIFPSVS